MENQPVDNSLEQPSEVASLEASMGSGQAQPTANPLSVLPVPGNRRRLPFKFHKVAFLSTVGLMMLGLLIGGALVFVTNRHQAASSQLANQNKTYKVSSQALKALASGASELQVGQAERLSINGELRVRDSVVLTPGTAPSAPTSGQIYYDKATNAPYYFNGTQFISLAPTVLPQHITSLGGVAGAISVGDGIQVTNGQLALTSTVLQQLSSAAARPTGVTTLSLAAGTSSIAIGNDGNGNYILSSSAVVGSGSVNQIALFTGGQTLGSSILSQPSNSVIAVGGSLTVTGAISTNSIQQTAAGNDVSISAGSDVLVFTAGGVNFRFPTGGPADQVICTTGISCASGGGQAVLLQPGAAQLDAGAGPSLFINNTNSANANILQLQGSGSDRFVVTHAGDVTASGSITSGTASQQGSLVVTAGNGNKAIFQVASTLAQNTTYTFPDPGSGSATICLSSGNCAATSVASGDLTGNYPNPTIAKLQGTTLNISSLASGQILQYNGTQFVNQTVSGDVTLSNTGVTTIGAGKVTNANLVNSGLTITAGTGLSGGGTVALGGTTSLSVQYGLVAGTAVQGNMTLTCASGTGNLMGGGGTITLGAGGTCGAIAITNSPSFTNVTLSALGAGVVQSNGSGLLSSGAISLGSATYVTGTLAVANGGTGSTTLTSNGILYGAGTGAIQATAAAANSVLATNGSSTPALTQTLPGTVQSNITGTGALSSGSIASGFGSISTANNITTSAAIQGGTLTVSGAVTLSSLNSVGVVHTNSSGVLSTGAVILGSDTTGSYIASLGTLTGLTAGGTSGAGGVPTLSVSYGSSATSAVRGNTTLVCPSGSGNLTGGGNTITLGLGGTCNGLDTVAAPSFSGIISALGGLTISSGANLVNNGSTLLASVAIANHATGGDIGSAAITVDAATTFDITQTTGGQVLTLPTPLVGTSGRIVYVNSLAGNTSFTMYGVTMTSSSSAAFIWNGNAWVPTSAGGNSINTIGAVNGQTKSSNGAVIVGSTLYLQTADLSNIGLVSTGVQSFAGAKTFSGVMTASSGLTVSSGGVSVTAGGLTVSAGGASISGGLTSAGATTLSSLSTTGVVHNSAAGLLSTSLILNSDLTVGTYTSITGTGALSAGSIAAGFGTISTANTITGTILNGTTAVNTGAGAGTTRIDVNGNLVNIGTITSGLINGQTISSAANLTGSLAVAGATTLAGSLTTNGGLTNNGATLNAALALGDLSAGTLGTAASTVDVATSFTISPTAAGRTYTLPSPTIAIAGRIIYVSNINATNSFTIGSVMFAPGSTAQYIWNGSAWSFGSIDTGVTTIGAIDSQTKSTNGAVISGNILYLQSADGTNAGLVSTGAQTLAGAKTFSGAASFTGSGTGLAVTNGVTIGGTLAVTGSINTTSQYQINGAQITSAVLSNDANLAKLNATQTFSGANTFSGNVAITGASTLSVGTGATALGGVLTTTGAITGSNTIQGTSVNGTTGLNTGSAGGTQRIDASGNLVNIGTITSGLINGQTISAAASFTGTLAVQGGTLTVGVAGSTPGSIVLANTSSTRTVSIQGLSPVGTGNATIQIPSVVGGTTDQVCLQSLANCTGTGGGIAGSGTQNYLSKFDTLGGNHIGSSMLYDDGNGVSVGSTTTTGLFNVGTLGQFYVASNGAVTAVGVDAGSGLIQGSGGQTITGTSALAVLTTTGNATIGGGLTVTSGTTTLGGAVLVQGSAGLTVGSTTTSGAIKLLDGTTSGFAATIGTNTLSSNLSFTLPTTGGTLCTTTTCASGGSGNYVQNQVTVQTGSNFYLRSVGSSNVVGVVEGANGQTANLFNFNTFNGTSSSTVASINATGGLTASAVSTTTLGVAGAVTFSGLGTAGVVHNSAAGLLSTSLIVNSDLSLGSYNKITGTGALASGSIVNGFGSISTNNNITSSATIQGATVNAALQYQIGGVQITSAVLSNDADLAKLSATQTFTGVNTFSNPVTLNGVVNNGATLNTSNALGDLAAGAIGTAAATVDVNTSFTISPTASGRTYTLPAPTNTAAGRIIYVSNVSATNSFTIGSLLFSPGSTAQYIWNGSAWSFGSIDTGVTTVGTIDSQTKSSNGATIVGNNIYLQTADASNSGLISTGTQVLAGTKTFSATGTALTVTNNASIGGNLQLHSTQTAGRLNIGTDSEYTSAGGILFGSDTTLYRNDVGTLRTNGTFNVGGDFYATSGVSSLGKTDVNVAASDALRVRNSGTNILVVDTSTQRTSINGIADTAGLTIRTNGTDSALSVISTNAAGYGSALRVGTGSTDFLNISNYGKTIFKAPTGANDAAFFQVQNSSGTNVIGADAQHNWVYINKSSASYTLDVNGDANLTSGSVYRINGVQLASTNLGDTASIARLNQGATGNNISSTSAFIVQSASNGTFLVDTINNRVTTQKLVVNSTLDVVGGGATTLSGTLSVTGSINTTSGPYQINGTQITSAALSNDTDLAKLSATQTFAGANTFSGAITASSTALFKTTTNNATAFQIQNASSVSVLTANTTALSLTIGSSASGQLGPWATNTAVLPVALTGQTTVTANGYLYVLGGFNSSAVAQTAVYYAKVNSDGSHGAWTTSANPFPVTRPSSTSVVLNGYIYSLGGATNGGVGTVNYYAKLNADGSTSAWTQATSLPVGVGTAASTASNGYIYIVGGHASLGSLYYAKPNADGSIASWSTNANFFSGIRKGLNTFVANGYIYAVGGSNATTVFSTVYYAKLAADGSAGTWSTNANALPALRAYAASGVANGYAYIVGGQDASTTLSTVYYAKLNTDGSTAAWTTNPNALPATRGLGSYAMLNGYLYDIAGSDSGGTYQTSTYYASTQRLSVNASLDLVGVSNGALSSSDGIGGELTAGNTNVIGSLQVAGPANFESSVNVLGRVTLADQLFMKNTTNSTAALQVQNAAGTNVFNIDTSNLAVGVGSAASGQLAPWAIAANALPSARSNASAVTANGYTYLIGGLDSTSTGQATVYYAKLNADGSPSTWTTSANPLPAARSYHSSVVSNGYVYVIGGDNAAGTSQTSIYYAKLNADGSTGAWQTNTTVLPAARDYHASVVANGYVYVIGGSGGQTTVYYAKINTDGSLGSWTTNTNALTAARYASSAVVANGYVYVIGGFLSSTSQTTVYYAKLNADGSTGTWTTNANALPAARDVHTSVVANGYVYVIGGKNASTLAATTYYAKLNADGSTGTWTTNANALLANVAWQSTVIANGVVYVMGGNNTAGGAALTSVYYASTQRLQVNASLDLIGVTNGSLANADSGAGELTAGNTNIVGNLQVQGAANFASSINVLGRVTLADQLFMKNTTNSTAAFQVQTAGGLSIFNVDTSNGAINVGGAINTPGVSSGSTNSTSLVLQSGAVTGTATAASGAVNIQSGVNLASGATGAVTLLTGNATAGASGSITIDAGTALATTGTISVGSANASSVAIGRTGAAASVGGTAITINTSGQVGIGNTSPGYILHVGSSATTTGTSVARFENAGGTCTITPNTAGGITCTSDSRLKKNIGSYSADTSLSKILGMNIVDYNLLAESNGDQKHTGVIAQDFAKLFPDLVNIDDQGYYSVSYSGLTPYLAGAVQAQQAQISGLQSQINSLNARLNSPSFSSAQVSGQLDAGSVTVSTQLTTANLNVSGASTLTSLTVTGDATVQGTLTVATIKVGTLEVSGHLVTQGDAPVTNLLPALGSSGLILVNGNDTAGTITLTTGAAGMTSGDLGKLIFSNGFGKAPKIIMSPQDEASQQSQIFPANKSANDFTLKTGQVLPANTTYTFDYIIVE